MAIQLNQLPSSSCLSLHRHPGNKEKKMQNNEINENSISGQDVKRKSY